MNLLFDYDGTIHNCIKIYEPAFRVAENYLRFKTGSYHANNLDTPSEIPLSPISTQELEQWLGDTPIDMWNAYAPTLSENDKQQSTELIKNEMIQLTNQGYAELYPHTTEVLSKLRNRSYHLILLSNCQHEYMAAHIKAFQLDCLFDDIYCSADYHYAPKSMILPTIQEEHPDDFTIIGDRSHDMDIAKQFHYPSIGCCYGYGSPEELMNATYKIHDIRELLNIL